MSCVVYFADGFTLHNVREFENFDMIGELFREGRPVSMGQFPETLQVTVDVDGKMIVAAQWTRCWVRRESDDRSPYLASAWKFSRRWK